MLSRIDDLFDQFQVAKKFSKIDMRFRYINYILEKRMFLRWPLRPDMDIINFL